MFNLKLTDEVIFMAQLSLVQAGIPPLNCDCTGPCGCQYRIDRFGLDIDSVEIVDDGVLYKLCLRFK